MLQAFREHKRWLMFILMVLVIPSFVVTGIYSYNRISHSDDNVIAKVGGEAITTEQFDQAKRVQLDNLRQQLGENFRANILDNPQSRQALVDNLLEQAAIRQAVAKNYVTVSEAAAVQLIKNASALQRDGKFDPDLYKQFLASQGMSDEQFVMKVRGELAQDTLLSSVSSSYPLPKTITQNIYNILNEQRQVQTLIFDTTPYLDKVNVSTDEVKAYYDSHLKDYMSPEHVKAQFVVFSPDDFQDIKVNEDEVKAYYEQNKQHWSTQEQRRASHILIDFGNDKAAALKKAQDIMAQVKADPKKFAQLAKEYSSDTGSASVGGDLSWFGRGLMVKPFEDAVFNAKKGDIIGPVASEFGYHIIYVTDVRPAQVKPFDEVKDEIEHDYREQEALKLFNEKADEFTNLVYEQSDSLEPVAKRFGLKIETADMVTREGVRDPELRSIITDHVTEALFSADVLKDKRNTNAIDVGSNKIVAARVVQYYPQSELPFDEVKSGILEKLKQEKAAEMAMKEGQAKLAQLLAKKDLKGFSKPIWVSRLQPQGEPMELVNAQVAVPAKSLPTFVGTTVPGGAYMVSYVSESKLVPAQGDVLKSLMSELSATYGEADKVGYLRALEESLGLEVKKPDFAKQGNTNTQNDE